MFNYCVTFRIANKRVGLHTAYRRRRNLIERLRGEEAGLWQETTSFVLMQSSRSTEELARYASVPLSAQDDLLVVFDTADMSCAYFGAVEHSETLESFFQACDKV